MSIALKIEDISKMYRLGTVGTGTLSHDINRYWAMLRGRPDPTLKIGMENNRAESGGDYVWALRDINLEVKQGEILGIIGRNGAGKSTLLKLLSRVTAPTTGAIKAKGRIASLLEVGTGFHPELTGRENVYLNGAIMGMTRPEITRRLDEIVEFSGCAKYIDTPVKRFSSGMTVRLGFAVAAHLDCEILIVDEVLAVGDSKFQKKCIGKIQEVTEDSGKTVLFVSHNMNSIGNLCTRAVTLDKGTSAFEGDVCDAIELYESLQSPLSSAQLHLETGRRGTGAARIRSLHVTDESSTRTSIIQWGNRLGITFEIENTTDANLKNVCVGYSISTPRGDSLIVAYSDREGCLFDLSPGMNKIKVLSGPITLNSGNYLIGCRIVDDTSELDWPKSTLAAITVHVEEQNVSPSLHGGKGLLWLDNNWSSTNAS